MFKIKVEMKGLDKLDKHIEYVNKLLKMKTDENFQKFIQDKCMQTLNKVMNERLTGGTTNDDAITLYKSSNHLQEEPDGFVIYNDAKIPAIASQPNNYPGGQFSIALAFEYGVGIVGDGTYTNDHFQPWDYNINKYNFGWKYPKGNGHYGTTYGYMGFEIYRYTAIEIEKNLSKWVNEYYRKKV